MLGGYLNRLQQAGFNEDQAWVLVRDFAWLVLHKSNYPDEAPMPPSSCGASSTRALT